ncbi:uncharacterized protein PV07_08811 [Cladophialophora immunda]|uniref:Uncharacterized protein n=1 Tax=Cladophialophora immunda TaxID=569365 RepID=A0A0D2C599_9EURO|nr:uncharacterized protein PV07_08811 [Cladophialophora immunda]KIW25645.1 hypothetical protein PV07_08811 [Cladophialophora immunda]
MPERCAVGWYVLPIQARSIERTIPPKSTGKAVLDATTKTAELYFQALHLADKPSDKQRLDARFNELLAAQNEQQRPVPTAASKEVLKPPISSSPREKRSYFWRAVE